MLGLAAVVSGKAYQATAEVIVFSDFKKKQLLQIRGSTLVIRDRAGLEKILEN